MQIAETHSSELSASSPQVPFVVTEGGEHEVVERICPPSASPAEVAGSTDSASANPVSPVWAHEVPPSARSTAQVEDGKSATNPDGVEPDGRDAARVTVVGDESGTVFFTPWTVRGEYREPMTRSTR